MAKISCSFEAFPKTDLAFIFSSSFGSDSSKHDYGGTGCLKKLHAYKVEVSSQNITYCALGDLEN